MHLKWHSCVSYSDPMYQDYAAQRITCTSIPTLDSKGSCSRELPHQDGDIPVDFARSNSSSTVKVISGSFGALAGPPLTLQSDVTGAVVTQCNDSFETLCAEAVLMIIMCHRCTQPDAPLLWSVLDIRLAPADEVCIPVPAGVLPLPRVPPLKVGTYFFQDSFFWPTLLEALERFPAQVSQLFRLVVPLR